MIELPEALTYERQMNQILIGKTVDRVLPPSTPHKFCWFSGDPSEYDGLMRGKCVEGAEGFGIYVELHLSDGIRLTFNDGVNVRWIPNGGKLPDKYQLLILFEDGGALSFTVAMYGGILCGKGMPDNKYYQASRTGVSPLSAAFTTAYLEQLIAQTKQSVSLKAFLATEQRIPGLGNGCLQDILLCAGQHPKTKISQLSANEVRRLCQSVVTVLKEMKELGGRDTEKDLFGNPGGYHTKLSRNTLAKGCPYCGGSICKEAYLGGAIYYCPVCQSVGGRF